AQQTWPKEAKKWANLDVHVQALTGLDSLKLDQFNRNGGKGFFTTNYEQIPNIVRLFDPWPFRTIILDESTRCAGFRTRQGTKRMQILAKVAWLPQVQRLIQLTGTPAPNGLKNLWGQLWFLDKGQRLGKTYNAFTSRWFAPSWDGYGVVPFKHSQGEIQDLIADLCITIDPRDYMEVDEPIETVIEVELPHEARKLYREMERAMFFELSADGADIEVEAFGAASRINKCLQIANGFVYHGDERNWAPLHEAKLDALESIVEEAGGMPLLVSYQFKTDLLMLKKRFPKGMTLDEVTEDEWNAGKVPLLFAHPASAGHGLNLQWGSNILVDYSSGWNLEYDDQIVERIGPMRQFQAGLDRAVYRYRLVAVNTVDEMVAERRQTKASVQDILLAAMKRYKPRS
ncbi:MAG: DEAD/DEAH box helicase, partial [Ramlibacter sp.]|nr:DEAD/DEAH box helicase [Ramlibacter sp.]